LKPKVGNQDEKHHQNGLGLLRVKVSKEHTTYRLNIGFTLNISICNGDAREGKTGQKCGLVVAGKCFVFIIYA
jgi:hypothetical protein